MSDVLVKKFGGTSVDDYTEVQKNIEGAQNGDKVIAVVSAFSGQTDSLFSIAREFLAKPMSQMDLERKIIDEIVIPLSESGKFVDDKDIEILLHTAAEVVAQAVNEIYALQQTITEKTPPEQKTKVSNSITDRFIAIGEILASQTLARIFTTRSKIGKVYEAVDLTDLTVADGEVITGEPLYTLLQNQIGAKVNAILERGHTPILPGHIRIAGGIAEVFDRGYTDTTAALTAVAMHELEKHKALNERGKVTLEIWKEVPGLLSGDPRLLEPDYSTRKPRKLADFQRVKIRSSVSRSEAAELTGFGTMKAVNAYAIDVLSAAFRQNPDSLKVFVRNTFEPELPGSQIVPDGVDIEDGIRFIAGRKGLCIITMRSASRAARTWWNAQIAICCAEENISIISTSGSTETTSFSIESNEPRLAELLERLKPLGLSGKPRDKVAMVCCIGNGMNNRVGALAEMSSVLAQAGINILYPDGDADTNTIFMINDTDLPKAMDELHRHFVDTK